MANEYGLDARGSSLPGDGIAVALDLGGTNLRMALVERSGGVISRKQLATPRSREAILGAMGALVGEGLAVCHEAHRHVAGVGISTGGQVDYQTGVIVASTALIPDWSNVPLRTAIGGKYQLPVFADNDGNCAAAAEKIFGRGKDLRNFLCLVLGTGIGGGVYVDGKLLRGAGNFAGELGHVTVDANGPECSCGGRGCVELYASGSGIARWAKEDPHLRRLADAQGELTSRTIGDASRSGDASATALLNAAGERLGIAAAGLVNVFNPQSIILGGSLLDLGSPYLDRFRDTVTHRAMKAPARALRIELSQFPQEGGILGAAALVFQEAAA